DSSGHLALSFHQLGHRSRKDDVIKAIETECHAQIEKVLDAGICPTHLDSEKHHAVWSPISKLAAKLAKEYGIPAMRNLQEPVAYALRVLPWPGMGHAFRAAMLRTYATLSGNPSGVALPDLFFGQTHIGKMDERLWLSLAENLPEGTSEVMVHPGEEDANEMKTIGENFGRSWIDPARPVEMNALLSGKVKKKLEDGGIELISFAAFADATEQ
ncbi:MAG: ChbG/HpnK family deacetylase, partial [Planctomycetes bacterium]|nr:ChbG/HpnK family deacetylase [Planctomycetota bacterium]